MQTDTFLIAVLLAPSVSMALLFGVCIVYNFRMDRKINKIIHAQIRSMRQRLDIPSPIKTEEDKTETATLDTLPGILKKEGLTSLDNPETEDK